MAQLFESVAKMGRKLRKPVYEFSLKTRPWQLQPFCAAPVLPGETMKNLRFQSRVVSDPILAPLVGWHKEYYFFYVKLRDMVGAEDFEQMMLDPNKDMSAYRLGADPKFFHSYGINWAELALNCVVKEYFRAEDEPATQLIDGLPVVSLNKSNALESAMTEAEYSPPDDVAVDLDADTVITVGEIERAQSMYDLARQMNLTSMDFEDYLRTFGIRVPTAESHKPELLRMVKEWSYPANTVDPATGQPSSAMSWSIQDRADKDRLFKEPGFILGLTVSRPKIYLSNYGGSANGLLDNAFSWLPAVMRGDSQHSFVHVETAANGPLKGQTTGYWFDMADLFLNGEQFVNFATGAEVDVAEIAMPTAALEQRYPTGAMADALFKAPAANQIREDGRLDLSIAGSVRDMSPPVSRQLV